MTDKSKEHWENVYETKNPNEVSWTQQVPKISLDLISSLGLNRQAKIIDIGGGDSKLVDHLLELGFEHITVLDISEKALEKAKKRLGKNADKVNWIVSDITDFEPETTFDLWHDRAAFHFLTSRQSVEKYLAVARKSVSGFMIIGTFSENGPTKCSGLNIQQYSQETLTAVFDSYFEKINCLSEDHKTPFDTIQNFLFCSYKKRV